MLDKHHKDYMTDCVRKWEKAKDLPRVSIWVEGHKVVVNGKSSFPNRKVAMKAIMTQIGGWGVGALESECDVPVGEAIRIIEDFIEQEWLSTHLIEIFEY